MAEIQVWLLRILIFSGAVLMAIAVRNARQLLLLLKGTRYLVYWQMLTGLIWFFLVGYIVALVMVFVSGTAALSFLTGFVYFFGAVFALEVVQIGRKTLAELFSTTVSKAYVESIIKIIPEVLVVADENQLIRDVNQAAVKLSGFSESQLHAKKLTDLFPEFSPQRFACDQRDMADETFLSSGDGKSIPISLSISTLQDERGQVLSYVCLAKDITGQKQIEARLEHEASHDTLTGLPNRLLLSERLENAIVALNANPNKTFGLLFLDLDNFKEINDVYGHGLGDDLLQLVARRLECCVRRGDMVSRLGGDEFIIMIETIETTKDIELAVERILTGLNEPFQVFQHRIQISGSVGYLVVRDGSISAADALHCADQAMYAAKAAGRACARECRLNGPTTPFL